MHIRGIEKLLEMYIMEKHMHEFQKNKLAFSPISYDHHQGHVAQRRDSGVEIIVQAKDKCQDGSLPYHSL